MGSGKTTLGRRLAALLDSAFIDLDAMLAEENGRSVGDLLVTAGEASFRQLELQALRRLLQEEPVPGVVATGGGIVEIPEALPLLRQLGRVVWLRADPQTCVSRLGAARALRPLLGREADWRRRYARREPLYRQVAQCIVDTDRVDVETSLAVLLRFVQSDAPTSADGV